MTCVNIVAIKDELSSTVLNQHAPGIEPQGNLRESRIEKSKGLDGCDILAG